jgi:hypothetical protein
LQGTFIHGNSEALLFPVEDGILHNTPALHHSSTPFKNHATPEPSLSDPPFVDPAFLCGGGPGF